MSQHSRMSGRQNQGKETILEVNNLSTHFETDRGTVHAVNGISYEIKAGETFGFVGESGAGKSVTGLSVMGLIEAPGKIVEGQVLYRGQDLSEFSEEEFRQIRGDQIAMVFQDSMTALNPAYRIGTQIIDIIMEHQDVTEKEAREKAIDLLKDVQIPNPEERINEFPHQFSGGMRQRVMIAMAISCNPKLIICDEPTTALDVTIQREILDLLKELQDEYDMAIQMITHDMGVIAYMCDHIGVMYAGQLIETGPVDEVFASPSHPYTIGLMNAIPNVDNLESKLQTIPGTMPSLTDPPSGCSFADRCDYAKPKCRDSDPDLEKLETSDSHESACIRVDEIDFPREQEKLRENLEGRYERTISDEELVKSENLYKYFTPEGQSWIDRLNTAEFVHAVDDVSLTVYEGETLGLVGESGCGKTTLGRTLSQLYTPDAGTVVFSGADLTEVSKRELRELREGFQVIFQDPFASLNPRKTVVDIIGRPMELYEKVSNDKDKREKVVELLDEVGLEKEHANRYPHEFSGGQRQRIGIARALAVEPDFIIADEPVSALDVSVQAQILDLMEQLQRKYGITYLFIAHDLNVVQYISDRIAVMYLGQIIEQGTVEQITRPPYHPYTEVLLSSILQPDPGDELPPVQLEGELPSPTNPPTGCRFHTRCPYSTEECATNDPRTIHIEDGHTLKCHIFDNEMDDWDDLSEIKQSQSETYERF